MLRATTIAVSSTAQPSLSVIDRTSPMKPNVSIRPISRQHGAALIVSLVMMVVLTLIGVVAMNSSNIELVMASNTQLQARALANAESTLTTAEAAAEQLAIQTSYTEAGYYNISAQGSNTAQDPTTMNWDGSDSAEGSTPQNRFMVEFTGNHPLPGGSIGIGKNNQPFSSVNLFRVTARAEDAKGAVRMVQSILVQPL